MMMKTIKKTKQKSFFGKIFTITFLVVTICLSVSLADLFSSLIAVGGFSFVNDDVSITKYTLYAVCTSSHNSKLVASEQAESCMNSGGAGYVWLCDDAFYVVASIYESESDAKKVQENILSSRPSAAIKKIVILPITISNNLSSQEKNTLNECLNAFIDIYKSLYDISVSLDTSVISEVNARLAINEIGSKITTHEGNFNTIFQNVNTSELSSIKNALENLSDIVYQLVESSSGKPFTSVIKNTYTKVVFAYQSLSDTLNK